MLTGDKLETATSIAKSSRLVSRNQECFTFGPVTNRTDAHEQLNNFLKKEDCALIISGDSLEVRISYSFFLFINFLCEMTKILLCYKFRFAYNSTNPNFWKWPVEVRLWFVVAAPQLKRPKL